MRDFSWQVFSQSGDVDAYLLYKATESEPDHAQKNEIDGQQTVQQLRSLSDDDQ